MTQMKEQNKSPLTNHEEMEVHELPDKQFKIIILRKCSELQEHADRQMKSWK